MKQVYYLVLKPAEVSAIMNSLDAADHEGMVKDEAAFREAYDKVAAVHEIVKEDEDGQ
jgi:hypothetical protein